MGPMANRACAGLAGAALLAGTLAGLGGAASATVPSFVPVATYTAPTNEPGPLACAGPSFCLQIADGMQPLDNGQSESLLSTDDAGATWTDLGPLPFTGASFFVDGPPVFSLRCASPSFCAIDTGSSFERTTDGGATWSATTGLPASSGGRTVACAPDGACVALGGTSTVRAYWLAPGAPAFHPSTLTLPSGITFTSLSCPIPTRCVLTGDSSPKRGAVEGRTYLLEDVGTSTARLVGVPVLPGRFVASASCPTVRVCEAVENVPERGPQPLVVLARSSDGGVTWVPQTRVATRHDTTGNLPTRASVACSTTLRCVVPIAPFQLTTTVGVRAMQTSDGGASWQTVLVGSFAGLADPFVDPRAFGACTGSGTCLVAGSPFGPVSYGSSGSVGFLRSSTGAGWSVVAQPAVPLLATGTSCTTSDTCWRIDRLQDTPGYDGSLQVSGDDGATWHAVATPAGDEPVLLGGCQGPSTCEVVAVQGASLPGGELGAYDYAGATDVLLTTIDGGSTWESHAITTGGRPDLASCTSPTGCVVLLSFAAHPVNPAEQLYSTTNGTTWGSFSVNVGFAGPDELLANIFSPVSLSCGGSGTCVFSEASVDGVSGLWSTTTGGASWTKRTSPSGQLLTSVSCVGDSTCVAAFVEESNAHAGIESTTNAAASWGSSHALPTGSSDNVVQVGCTSTTACTVVAAGSVVTTYDTTTGGAAWTQLGWGGTVPAGTGVAFLSPAFLTCSTTTCLVELVGEDRNTVSAHQLLRLEG